MQGEKPYDYWNDPEHLPVPSMPEEVCLFFLGLCLRLLELSLKQLTWKGETKMLLDQGKTHAMAFCLSHDEFFFAA